ncbi:MAG: hypothetical protein ACFFFT_06200 [Candidatus Thorarchaeota archaeon]
MVNLNIRKSKRIVILLSLTLMLSIAMFTPNLFNFSSDSSLTDIDVPDDPIVIDNIKTASYSTDYGNSGENLNISLHQSKIEVGTPLFEITNASDSNNNTFSTDCPSVNSFNSTTSYIDIVDIYAPNITLTIEDDYYNIPLQTITIASQYLSFNASGVGYIANISFRLKQIDTFNPSNITLDLYNASATGKPDQKLGTMVANNYFNDSASSFQWHKVTDLDFKFNASETNYDMFFIRIASVGGSGLDSDYATDSGGTDGVDESFVYRANRQDLEYFFSAGNYVDLPLIIDFYPLNNTPKPNEIGLKVNNSAVNNINGLNKGNWNITKTFSQLPNQLDYVLSAEWWDVSCNITKIQVNYTRSDLRASSSFIVQGSGQSILWNASRNGGINFFDSDFNNYKINFTVPANWEDLQTFNGTGSNKTDDTSLGPIVGGYRTLQIINAGNGTYWFINGTSNNLLQKIHTSVSSIEKDTVNYTDTVSFIANFTEPIIDGNINLTVYSPAPGYYSNHTYANNSIVTNSLIPLQDWTISDNATDNYGIYTIQVYWNNGTAAGFLEKDLIIMAITDLRLISPPSGEEYFGGEIFNIALFYNDTGYNQGNRGITGATLTENSGSLPAPSTNGTDGYYIYSLNTSDYIFGWNTIIFEASKQPYYNNDTTDFTFYLRINTTIDPSNTKDFGNVIKGQKRTYNFTYLDIDLNPIQGATLSEVNIPTGFGISLSEVGGTPGNYSIELDTSGVTASITPYTCIFNITAPRNETQYIYLTLTVTIAQTKIDIISKNDILVQKDGLNQTILFSFNNSDINKGISGLDVSNVTVIDNQTLLPRPSIWLYTTATDGEYILNVSVSDLTSGWIQLEINASLPPNYNYSTASFNFYLRGNTTQINLISFEDRNGEGLLTGIGDNYSCFIERDLYTILNITDFDNGDNLLTGDAEMYRIDYTQIGNSSNSGTLGHTLDFVILSNTYRGDLLTSNLVNAGSYSINITIKLTNYEEATYSFNLTLKAKYIVNITVIDKPIEITAGASFNITLGFEYYNGTDWLTLVGANVRIVPYFNGLLGTPTSYFPTDGSGEVFITIFSSDDAKNMTLVVELQGSYYHVSDTLDISDITVNAPDTGLSLKDFIPYLIIIGAALAVAGGSIGVYKGIIVPKKREKSRILKEVKTIFDDAINLEHILILYKGTGTCIYFKSFGTEGIDPELISGFISAICSFGKDLVCQEELNEVTYGDRMLLLSDGEYIRVALVLSKKASIILRKNLKDFITDFEKSYESELPNWRGQLNIFRNSGALVDDILSTSIILPHEITYKFSNVKALKNPHSKDVLKVANSMMKDSERNFFFIATLLKEATEKTNKDTAEIFMGIKELRDKKILVPIEIGVIEAQPVSQQELALINQKVAGLVNLSQEEKQKLINDLAQMGPAEREAYFVSLTEQHEIISAPIEEKPGAAIIDNVKGAKKEISKLKKIGKIARKEKDYEKSINIFQNASKIAINWELSGELEQLNEFIRSTKIEDLRIKMKTLEKEAKLAAKEENYNEAAQKYKMSSKIASEIFKLGGTEMTKEVKRLSNKSKEYEKLI